MATFQIIIGIAQVIATVLLFYLWFRMRHVVPERSTLIEDIYVMTKKLLEMHEAKNTAGQYLWYIPIELTKKVEEILKKLESLKKQ